ncbi:MAG: B12-binding domain-containing radical SAM protein [Lentisphaerae bacterium RIFOXYB12_FULL_65_16]|nr:MAG: B12-binding domain-containing radical SAM protein [Lentisphaerae bacterium RIFOXYA12_64_32]OGV92263.1 MAG: B12-binding domain-containing radical SAM protein [Lentisphaerae bacterium RIFOXYB12_FULL_65_16]
MNILLIYPEFPDTFWSFRYALEFVGKRAAHPPLGLLTVASMLPKDWSLRLVDTNVCGLRKRDLDWADGAFVSAMAVQRESARQIIGRCREAGLLIVAGGPLFTSEHAQFDGVDHFVLNEAELTLPGFLADLAQGRARRVYASDQFADLHQTPSPKWDLLDLRRYASMSIQFCRGCPFNCDFCTVTALLGHRVRMKTSRQIIAELDGLYALGWREEVFFVDDNFIGNKEFLKTDLLPTLIAWRKGKRGITFYTEASINLAEDEPLMEMMVEAGFNRVFVGIETPDENCLTECRKLQNRNRDLLADVKRMQRIGLEVQGGFIVGFDHDHPSIFQRQIDFIQTSGIATAMVGLLQAPPGTRLYERLKKEGRLRGESSGDNVDGTTNFLPTMDADVLRQGYRRILEHIYAPEHYYQRLRTYLHNCKPSKVRGRIRLSDLYAYVRALWQLGIVGRERFHYWRLLLWAQFLHPRLLHKAVTLAIYGYHFRKMCDRHVA